jgi:osmotically-inducible protein OsmY
VIGTRGGTVAVRGLVDDIDDTDNVVEVISRVSGVDEVIDELEVRGVTD